MQICARLKAFDKTYANPALCSPKQGIQTVGT